MLLLLNTSTHVTKIEHTSAYVSMRQHTPPLRMPLLSATHMLAKSDMRRGVERVEQHQVFVTDADVC